MKGKSEGRESIHLHKSKRGKKHLRGNAGNSHGEECKVYCGNKLIYEEQVEPHITPKFQIGY